VCSSRDGEKRPVTCGEGGLSKMHEEKKKNPPNFLDFCFVLVLCCVFFEIGGFFFLLVLFWEAGFLKERIGKRGVRVEWMGGWGRGGEEIVLGHWDVG